MMYDLSIFVVCLVFLIVDACCFDVLLSSHNVIGCISFNHEQLTVKSMFIRTYFKLVILNLIDQSNDSSMCCFLYTGVKF